MNCSEETGPIRRIGSARSFVIELAGCGQINPNPITAEEPDLLVELYLSPEKLRCLSGSDDLDQVTNLEMCVDTRENSLGNFGVYLPNLVQLKMNYSLILSVRDLGTTLSHLQVLSLVHCGLTDLDGIHSLTSLKELYVAYNKVTDLSPVSMLEHLELLDLERNNVDDLVQVQYLGLCGKLRTLSLEGNPVCTCPNLGASEFSNEDHLAEMFSYRCVIFTWGQVSEYNYRSAVRKLIPQLCYLDDIPVEEEEVRSLSSARGDFALLKEFIKDNASFTGPADNYFEHIDESNITMRCLSWTGSANRPSTSLGFSSLARRPATARPSSSSTSSRPGSAESDLDALDRETSDLTHGVGGVRFCGNPVHAVRARRQKIKLQNSNSNSRPCTQLGSFKPEHTYDTENTHIQDRSDVFAELRAWRKEHSKRLSEIARERQPQIMSIVYSDADDDSDGDGKDNNEDDKEDHNLRLISYRTEEKEMNTGYQEMDSPDSSFQSFSPDLSIAVSPEVPVCSSLDHTPSPSPPPRPLAPSSGKSTAGIRSRRLRLSNVTVDVRKDAGESFLHDQATPNQIYNNLETLKIQPLPPQVLRKPNRPTTTPVTCSEPAGGCYLTISEHKPVIGAVVPRRPVVPRPHTARAVLQRLPDHRARTLLTSKEETHLDRAVGQSSLSSKDNLQVL